MAVPLSAAAKSVLAARSVRVLKKLEVVKELYDADARVYNDITAKVLRWGTLSGASTVKAIDWELPALTVLVRNDKSYFSEGHVDSLWTNLGIAPNAAWVKLQLLLPLLDGTLETMAVYYGKIQEAVAHDLGDFSAVELVTRHAADDALKARITKASAGDEHQVLGTSW